MSLHVQIDRVSKVFPTGSSATGDLVAAMKGSPEQGELHAGKIAINNLSLSIGIGERLGIVGRNGAGKSTLLHMIAGLSDPTSGAIQISGKVTSIMTLGIGLRDDLSGRECIFVDGEIQGRSRAEVEAIIEQVIEFSELGEFIEYPVRTYSTGMKARLAFAMISHIDPEILIIDEALSVGDASFSTKATARILEICARGKIVILVSHGMESVRAICNRCIYLKDGQIVMDGTPEDVTKAYIDEVQETDEAALIEKFQLHVGNRSLRNGYAIEEVSLLSGEGGVSRVRVEAEQTLRIQVRGRHQELDLNTLLRVRIIRLDDLLLFSNDFPSCDYALGDEKIGIEVKFPRLALGAAIYRLDVLLMENGQGDAQRYAEFSTMFEVFKMDPPRGGKPMLFYPVVGSVTRI